MPLTKTPAVFPPDAGSANAGNVPNTNCGRGITRRGDIRRFGDNLPAGATIALTDTFTPGTISSSVVVPNVDNVNAPQNPYPNSSDGQAAPETFNSAGTFGGLDASSEGADTFSSKQGQKG
jgi:hypothetical protein